MSSNNYSFKLQYLALIPFSFYPIIPNRLEGLTVVFLLAISVYLFITEKNKKFPFVFFFKFSSIYIILLLSLFYTDNFIKIDKLLSTRLSLIVVPASIGFLYASNRKIEEKFLFRFSKILFAVTTFYSICILYYLYRLGVFSQTMSLYDALAYITNEMWLISQHPIYASIFLSISMLLIMNTWFKEKNKVFILSTLPLIIVQLFTLYLLERKGVLLSFSISLLLLIYFTFKEKFTKKIIRTILLSSVLIISVLLFSSQRFKEIFKKENYSNILNFNSTSLRYGIYICSLEKIKEAPILGYGLGDVQNELKKCYEEKSKLLTQITYNSHNQYLSYFLSTGILGFFLLLFLIITKFIDAIKEQNYLLLAIIIFFSIIMLFENILERQSGVILFSFYMCLFSLFNFTNKKQKRI